MRAPIDTSGTAEDKQHRLTVAAYHRQLGEGCSAVEKSVPDAEEGDSARDAGASDRKRLCCGFRRLLLRRRANMQLLRSILNIFLVKLDIILIVW